MRRRRFLPTAVVALVCLTNPAAAAEASSTLVEAPPADAAEETATGGSRVKLFDGGDHGALSEIVVEAKKPLSAAASDEIRARDFDLRPHSTLIEILNNVPGLVVAQHQGGSKAAQYLIRGFDSDHGTDFALFVDGTPVNLVSHAHGQGYADLNFVIPETIERLRLFKGPYFVQFGDFMNAGALDLVTKDRVAEPSFLAEGGSFDTQRYLFEQSSVSGYLEEQLFPIDWMRLELGLRGDVYFLYGRNRLPEQGADPNFDANFIQGTKSQGLPSPKANLVLSPLPLTDFYLNFGMGFHSNDARVALPQGVVTPGQPIVLHQASNDPLTQSIGAEIGSRTSFLPGLDAAASFWYLHLDSELVFSGDAGTVDADIDDTTGNFVLVDFLASYRWRNVQLNLALQNLTNTDWREAQFADDTCLTSELGTVPGCLQKPGRNPGDGVHDIHFTPGNPISVLAGLQVYF